MNTFVIATDEHLQDFITEKNIDSGQQVTLLTPAKAEELAAKLAVTAYQAQQSGAIVALVGD